MAENEVKQEGAAAEAVTEDGSLLDDCGVNRRSLRKVTVACLRSRTRWSSMMPLAITKQVAGTFPTVCGTDSNPTAGAAL